MRFACLHTPDFPVQALARIDEVLHQQAVAVLDGTPPLLTVIATNSQARQKGMYPGMTKVQAELFDVKLRPRNRAQETSAHQALLDCAYAFSPRVEDTKFQHLHEPGVSSVPEDGTVILDIEGLNRLHGTPQKIGQALQQLASRFGLEVNVGIAANPEAARLAARGFSGVTVIPAGFEAKHLDSLPISILNLSVEQQEIFRAWGIHTLQSLAALPEIGLIERLGQEGKRLQILARGANQRPLIPAEPELKFEESMEVEAPITLLEPLAFILGRLLSQLCNRLVVRSLAASEIRLELELEPPPRELRLDEGRRMFPALDPINAAAGKEIATFHQTTLRLPVPTQNSRTLLKLLHLDLQSHPPSAPIKKVCLAAEAARPRTVQNQLFAPPGPEPEHVEITLARIGVIVGKNRAGSPVLRNTCRPDAFQMKKFLVLDNSATLKKSRRSLSSSSGNQSSFHSQGITDSELAVKPTVACHPRSALRRFRPPVEAYAALKDGMPVFVTFMNQRRKVLTAAGPWRSSGDWWSETPWAREEWDVTLASRPGQVSPTDSLAIVATSETTVYRLYRDLQTQKWFMEGVYD